MDRSKQKEKTFFNKENVRRTKYLRFPKFKVFNKMYDLSLDLFKYFKETVKEYFKEFDSVYKQ